MSKQYLFLLAIGLLICLCVAERKYTLQILEVKCRGFTREIVEYFHCYLVKNEQKVYGRMKLSREEPKPVGRLELHAEYKGKRRIKLLDINFDACKITELITENKFLKGIGVGFRAVKPKITCPLQSKINYTLQGFSIPEAYLPRYLPEGIFHVKITGLSGKKLIKALTMQASIQVLWTNTSGRSR